MDALIAAGVVGEGGRGFRVALSAKHPALRDAAARGRLPVLMQAAATHGPGARYSYYGSADRALNALRELDVALALGGPSIDAALEHALETAVVFGAVPSLEVAARSVFPALALSFEPAWFEQLDQGLQSRLFELAVSFAETIGSGLGKLYGYALDRPHLFSARPAAHASLFGLTVLGGDWETATALAEAARPEQRSTLLAALSLATGDFGAEHAFVPPKRDEPIGVARVLQGLLLLGRGRAEDLAAAGRIVHAGNRKTSAFKSSSGWLKDLVELSHGRRTAFQKHAFESSSHADCLDSLLRAIFAIWADDAGIVELAPIPLERSARHFQDLGLRWLAAQYGACVRRLARSAAREGSVSSARSAEPEPQRENIPVRPEMTVRPLFELRTAKEPWELTLEALERVAATLDPSEMGSSSAVRERIVWRVSPMNLAIEPYLQTSKAGAFTRGRKLAVKHLLPGSKQLERLPPEDRAVAEHARERRESSGYGYLPGVPFFGSPRLGAPDRTSPRRAQ